jgi:hypothetical protein
MKTAFAACAQVPIECLEHRFVRMEVVEARCPDAIVRGKTHKVEAVACHEIEGAPVGRCRPLALPDQHPLEVESVMLHSAPSHAWFPEMLRETMA